MVQNHSNREGLIFAVLGYTSLSILIVFIKQATTTTLTTFELLNFRSFMLVFATLFILRRNNISPYPQLTTFKYLITQILLMNISDILPYYSLQFIPMSTVSTLFNISPIFVFFIEAIYFKKPLNRIGLGLTFVCFFGVILIIQPQFMFGSTGESFHVQGFGFYVFLVLVSAICIAGCMILIHKIGKTMESTKTMCLNNIGLIFTNGIICNFAPNRVHSQQVTWVLMAVLGGVVIFSFTTQMCLYRAYSITKPSILAPFAYLNVVVGFFADVYLFQTRFSTLAIIGIILTSAGLMGEYLMGEKDDQKSQKSNQAVKLYSLNPDKEGVHIIHD